MATASSTEQQVPDPAVLTALGTFDDAAHQARCTFRTCSRCKFIGNRERWLKQCPWLDSKYDVESKQWGVGCKVCSEALSRRPEMMKFSHHRHHFAKYEVRDNNLVLDRFKKHQKSPAHRTAAQILDLEAKLNF